MTRRFPDNFVLGAATAAYQIEGAALEDGRRDSIWDAFCRVPGAVINGDDGSVACDHYHRYPSDVAMMKQLGLQAYRFSTSWARIRPDGGPVNQQGLDFYSRLVDELLAAGIAPWLTLYHWDLPQALEEQGGWANRDIAYRFADYASTVYDALGDRVRDWSTLNEPWCSAFLGYASGAHAPGRQDATAAVAAGHHLLLGHGLALARLRETLPGHRGGITLNLTPVSALNQTPEDIDAARRIDGQANRFFLDPIVRGEYPDDLLDDLAPFGLRELVQPGDLEAIGAPIDFLGVNYYHGERVGSEPAADRNELEAPTERATSTPFPAADGIFFHSNGLPTTAMNWEIQPAGLTELLERVHNEYTGERGIPLVITENGAAFDDTVAADGSVPDQNRVAYLEAHLAAALDAVEAGVDLRGYFYWSLMDNFEWAWGYAKRFGIVRVDYDTQERTPKASAERYREIITAREM